ncbi:putative pyruvate-formate lyase [Methanothermobacter sp. CaT2]|uniref:glycyl radical enzyme domain-containing protein n=1 Tax=Methanothermobacter sp. CaT2 TaxID=866790 RepID=UPI0002CCF7C2|nr:glycyl radical enzyme domain-containing protein [Methanothermobacter sp. CaT2]BAM69541.1 putative pyruvate-formate lyase [Methanothermobacter sp. CaT2]
MKEHVINVMRRTPLFPYMRAYYTVYQRGGIGSLLRTRLIGGSGDILERRIQQFEDVCRVARITPSPGRFLYSIDTTLHVMEYPGYRRLGNLTPDYRFLLENGVDGIGRILEDKLREDSTGYAQVLMRTLRAVSGYLERCSSEAGVDIPSGAPETLEDAIQLLLTFNSLLWTYGHPLIGLGRLDRTLDGYPSSEDTHSIIEDLIRALSLYPDFKSNTLPGDTGQVIVLGGECNDLTRIFLDVMMELGLPDPKIVLRVNRDTPEDVWELALDCIERGLGYPLIANDEVIVDALREYYGDDAENYGTSACWEPLIPGRSSDQNNLATLNLLIPLADALRSGARSFEELLDAYRSALRAYIEGVIREVESLKFEPSPPLSLLFPDCIKSCRDIAEGGAAYSYNGVLTVGMGNLVNSLINIKRLSFDKGRMNLDDIIGVLDDNFSSSEALRSELENRGPKYGMDEPEVMDLTNRIIDMIHDELAGRYRFGLSSPSYIWHGEETGASFDGRRAREPLGVHISPVRLLEGMSYTGILNFASGLDYSKACNGGVVDLMIDRSFLERARGEFMGLIKTGIRRGIMQLQVNVVDPEVILEAARDPELHPDLIVRVWGFSAYFRDLPEEYRELIVRRALEYSEHGGWHG